jgi:hypothetical protein
LDSWSIFQSHNVLLGLRANAILQYYLPWELTEDQEELIADQVRDAGDVIEKETREFKQRKEQRLDALGELAKPAPESDRGTELPPRSPPLSTRLEKETAAEEEADRSDKRERLVGSEADTDQPLPGDPPPTHHETAETTNASSTSAEQAHRAAQHQEKETDEAGDVMVEGEEDTVIY